MLFPSSVRPRTVALALAVLASACSLDRAAFGDEPDASSDASIVGPADAGPFDAGAPGALLRGEGAFMRGSEASVLDRAGAVRFVAPHTRRTDDGREGLTLIEGARTNLIRRSQALSADAWSRPSTCTIQEDDGLAPDGTMTADRQIALLGDRCAQQSSRREPGHYSISAWFRADTTGPIRAIGAREVVIRGTSSLEWARLGASALVAAPRFDDVVLDGRLGHPSPSDPAIAQDVLSWGWQLEAARFASSYIRTAEESATRAADTWVFAQDDIDARLTTDHWQVRVEPEWTLAEVDGTAWVLSFSANAGLRFRRLGVVVLEAVVEDIPVATLQVPELERGDELRIDVEPSSGLLRVTHEGSTTDASASPWAWAIVGDVRIGGRIGGAEELFGWVSVPGTP